jgi:5-methylcytosine-specific restriction endonuclease McrA
VSEGAATLEVCVNEFGDATREAVYARSGGACEVCGSRTRLHLHHRRRRGIRGEHGACSCNALLLCWVCHDYVHAHPRSSREQGWLVHSTVRIPATVAATLRQKEVILDCGAVLDIAARAT